MRDASIDRRSFLWCLQPFLAMVMLGGCGKTDSRPPGLRLLKEKRERLRPDMTVAEVDAVMAGHPRKERRDERDQGDLMLGDGGSRLTRPSVMVVTYDDQSGAGEGDYCLEAFFDKDGRLVGVGFNEYWN
jgi:hypothetical protein